MAKNAVLEKLDEFKAGLSAKFVEVHDDHKSQAEKKALKFGGKPEVHELSEDQLRAIGKQYVEDNRTDEALVQSVVDAAIGEWLEAHKPKAKP